MNYPTEKTNEKKILPLLELPAEFINLLSDLKHVTNQYASILKKLNDIEGISANEGKLPGSLSPMQELKPISINEKLSSILDDLDKEVDYLHDLACRYENLFGLPENKPNNYYNENKSNP